MRDVGGVEFLEIGSARRWRFCAASRRRRKRAGAGCEWAPHHRRACSSSEGLGGGSGGGGGDRSGGLSERSSSSRSRSAHALADCACGGLHRLSWSHCHPGCSVSKRETMRETRRVDISRDSRCEASQKLRHSPRGCRAREGQPDSSFSIASWYSCSLKLQARFERGDCKCETLFRGKSRRERSSLPRSGRLLSGYA